MRTGLISYRVVYGTGYIRVYSGLFRDDYNKNHFIPPEKRFDFNRMKRVMVPKGDGVSADIKYEFQTMEQSELVSIFVYCITYTVLGKKTERKR